MMPKVVRWQVSLTDLIALRFKYKAYIVQIGYLPASMAAGPSRFVETACLRVRIPSRSLLPGYKHNCNTGGAARFLSVEITAK